ncbi:MAG: PH domain-containing protein [Proteobacteria bacterium]|nr:PH domain-containing protein [Pseudomonadota bacterium]
MAKEPVYIKNTLGKDEEIKWIADLHWIVYLNPVIYTLLGLLFLTSPARGIGIFFLFLAAWVLLYWRKTEYVITNRRVIAKRGIISVKTEELRNGKVESVYITQGIIERCFGCGTVVFGGTGGSKVKFKFIANPRQVKTHLEEIIEENK